MGEHTRKKVAKKNPSAVALRLTRLFFTLPLAKTHGSNFHVHGRRSSCACGCGVNMYFVSRPQLGPLSALSNAQRSPSELITQADEPIPDDSCSRLPSADWPVWALVVQQRMYLLICCFTGNFTQLGKDSAEIPSRGEGGKIFSPLLTQPPTERSSDDSVLKQLPGKSAREYETPSLSFKYRVVRFSEEGGGGGVGGKQNF